SRVWRGKSLRHHGWEFWIPSRIKPSAERPSPMQPAAQEWSDFRAWFLLDQLRQCFRRNCPDGPVNRSTHLLDPLADRPAFIDRFFWRKEYKKQDRHQHEHQNYDEHHDGSGTFHSEAGLIACPARLW